MSGKNLVPNSFQTPNAHVDEVMQFLTGDEYKVLNFATRHIMGWQDSIAERQNSISLTVFEKGFVTKAGKQFSGCGLSRPTIIKVLEELEAFGLLMKVGKPTSKGQVWRLSETVDWDRLIQRMDKKRSSGRDRTLKAREKKAVNGTNQRVVNPVNQQVVSETNQRGLMPLTDSGKSHLLNQTHLQIQQQNHQQKEAAAADNIFTLFEKAFGKKLFEKAAASAVMRGELNDMQEEYPLEWVEEAFRETALASVGSPVKYARAILKRKRDDKERADALAEAVASGQQLPVALEKPVVYAPEGMEREFEALHIAKQQLSLQLDKANFDAWVEDARFMRSFRREGGFMCIVIGCRSEFQRDMLKHKLYRTVRRVVTEVYEETVDLEFEVLP